LVAVTLQSARERLILRELAVSGDVVDQSVTFAAEILELETAFDVDCGDCTEVEDAGVPGDKCGRKHVFVGGGMW
jgi:hypothetical protein